MWQGGNHNTVFLALSNTKMMKMETEVENTVAFGSKSSCTFRALLSVSYDCSTSSFVDLAGTENDILLAFILLFYDKLNNTNALNIEGKFCFDWFLIQDQRSHLFVIYEQEQLLNTKSKALN